MTALLLHSKSILEEEAEREEESGQNERHQLRYLEASICIEGDTGGAVYGRGLAVVFS